jgi:hypothetical protein
MTALKTSGMTETSHETEIEIEIGIETAMAEYGHVMCQAREVSMALADEGTRSWSSRGGEQKPH